MELTNSDAARASDREAAWGESALFLTGNLSDKLSFLAESTFQAQEYREDQLTLERIRLRYELNRDHAISIGKMHTPVNYWNDSYHHGRFFYPTINRPLVFDQEIVNQKINSSYSRKILSTESDVFLLKTKITYDEFSFIMRSEIIDDGINLSVLSRKKGEELWVLK